MTAGLLSITVESPSVYGLVLHGGESEKGSPTRPVPDMEQGARTPTIFFFVWVECPCFERCLQTSWLLAPADWPDPPRPTQLPRSTQFRLTQGDTGTCYNFAGVAKSDPFHSRIHVQKTSHDIPSCWAVPGQGVNRPEPQQWVAMPPARTVWLWRWVRQAAWFMDLFGLQGRRANSWKPLPKIRRTMNLLPPNGGSVMFWDLKHGWRDPNVSEYPRSDALDCCRINLTCTVCRWAAKQFRQRSDLVCQMGKDSRN